VQKQQWASIAAFEQFDFDARKSDDLASDGSRICQSFLLAGPSKEYAKASLAFPTRGKQVAGSTGSYPAGGGRAILLVEQNLRVARAVADRHHVMNKGVICFTGGTAELENSESVLRNYLSV
jgi:hypothetical protein